MSRGWKIAQMIKKRKAVLKRQQVESVARTRQDEQKKVYA